MFVDIRDNSKEHIKGYIFAGEKDYLCPAIRISLVESANYIELQDEDGDGDGRVFYEDIPNLIKALEAVLKTRDENDGF